jgi:hypothetical protein
VLERLADTVLWLAFLAYLQGNTESHVTALTPSPVSKRHCCMSWHNVLSTFCHGRLFTCGVFHYSTYVKVFDLCNDWRFCVQCVCIYFTCYVRICWTHARHLRIFCRLCGCMPSGGPGQGQQGTCPGLTGLYPGWRHHYPVGKLGSCLGAPQYHPRVCKKILTLKLLLFAGLTRLGLWSSWNCRLQVISILSSMHSLISKSVCL